MFLELLIEIILYTPPNGIPNLISEFYYNATFVNIGVCHYAIFCTFVIGCR